MRNWAVSRKEEMPLSLHRCARCRPWWRHGLWN